MGCLDSSVSGGPALAGGAVISVGCVIAGVAAGLCFFPGIVSQELTSCGNAGETFALPTSALMFKCSWAEKDCNYVIYMVKNVP